VAKIWFLDVFVDPTLRTFQPAEILFLNPFRQCRTLRVLLALMLMMVMFTLSGLGAAVFTEPAITQIEKVGHLVHRSRVLH